MTCLELIVSTEIETPITPMHREKNIKKQVMF